MRDIMRAVPRLQRQGNSPGSDCRITATGGCKQLTKSLVDLDIAGDDPPPDRGQEITGVEHDLTGGIGVDDASARIDSAYPRAEAIERVTEAPSLRGSEIDKSADQHRPADMRNDKAHAPAHFIVDNT